MNTLAGRARILRLTKPGKEQNNCVTSTGIRTTIRKLHATRHKLQLGSHGRSMVISVFAVSHLSPHLDETILLVS